MTDLGRGLRRLGIVAVVTALLGTVAATHIDRRGELVDEREVLDDLRAELADVRSRLRGTSDALDEAGKALSRTEAELTVLADLRGETELTLSLTEGNLGDQRQAIWQAGASLVLHGLRATALDDCLTGVRAAARQVGDDDRQAALGSLREVAPSCAAVDGSDSGAAWPFHFPDPFVLALDGGYYAYATNSSTGNIQVMRANAFGVWEPLGDALPKLPEWATPNRTWAPSVLERDGYYVLYYAAHHREARKQCIARAVGLAPEGPFVDLSEMPMICDVGRAGTIDPSPFVDVDGALYLLFAEHEPSRIVAQRLRDDGLAMSGPPSTLVVADRDWEDGTVEGPAMAYADGGYHLFYSANDWNSDAYAIGHAVCDRPTGPCTKTSRPVLGSQGALVSPGGQELYRDSTGALWMAFHAYTKPAVGYPNSRRLHLARVGVAGDAVLIIR